MKRNARTQMIEGAVVLLAKRGLQATSFSEVLDLTQAPRGSIYHHFPEGKDELIHAAVELAGTRALNVLDQKRGASAEEITEYFLSMWREVLTRSQFRAGCAVLAVTVTTDSPELLEHSANIFRAWRGQLTGLFEHAGLPSQQAAQFAAMLIASSEGAVVLSRAEQSMEPFELVSNHLLAEVRRMVRAAKAARNKSKKSVKSK